MGDVAALTWPLTGPVGLYNPSRVRRCLFGPVNHEKARSQLEEHAEALMQQNKLRWNFDFENERPLPPGRYLWEKVDQPSDTDTKDTSDVSQPDADAESSVKEEQTHITDFMRKRKSSSKKDFVSSPPMKTRRRSST